MELYEEYVISYVRFRTGLGVVCYLARNGMALRCG